MIYVNINDLSSLLIASYQSISINCLKVSVIGYFHYIIASYTTKEISRKNFFDIFLLTMTYVCRINKYYSSSYNFIFIPFGMLRHSDSSIILYCNIVEISIDCIIIRQWLLFFSRNCSRSECYSIDLYFLILIFAISNQGIW